MMTTLTVKLRQHLKNQRLKSCTQLGVDRVLCLTFGTEANGLCHLLVEFHSGGNLILASQDWTILTLLRSHRDDYKGVSIMPNHPYPLHALRSDDAISKEKICEAILEMKPKDTFLKLLTRLVTYMGPKCARHYLLKAELQPDKLLDIKDYNPNQQKNFNYNQIEKILGAIESFRTWISWCKRFEDKTISNFEGF